VGNLNTLIMKNKLLILAMGFALTTQIILAQVPSYVPTNGLVGYWPFNGNANDESGNGNNGTVNGATLTIDRNENENSAYSFDGVNDRIFINNSSSFDTESWSISAWYLTSATGHNRISSKSSDIVSGETNYLAIIVLEGNVYGSASQNGNTNNPLPIDNNLTNNGQWHHVVYIRGGGNFSLYVDGVLTSQVFDMFGNLANTNPLYFGSPASNSQFFNGKLDDIGIWNRALTQQEITNLYNSTSTSECLTMTINTGVLSTTPVTYTSTVNIYPNPANDQITIDCGNLANVVGWNIKITNMLGQEVFSQPMNTQQYVVPLNSWTGQGMYFVKIINAQNEVVNIKKIILQ
jgi:hypothetical protein